MSEKAPQKASKPWQKWNPKAWLSDPHLRMCGRAAKGLWIDMLNLMMISPVEGYLVGPNKKAMPLDTLARLTGGPVDETKILLEELKDNRVFSVDSKGRIFSRRMIREQKMEEIGRKSANKRWENQPRNQSGTFEPTDPPKPFHGARVKRIESIKKEEGRKAPGGNFSARNPRARPSQDKTPWTIEQKRDYGHRKIAEALGDTGWEIVAAAADGNPDAIRTCKAKAKEISVTFYTGKTIVTA